MQYAYGTSGYALVSHHLIAHAAFVRKRNSWCSARCLPALLKTNAAFRFHFERCNPHFLFSVLTACPSLLPLRALALARLLVASSAGVNAKDDKRGGRSLHTL